MIRAVTGRTVFMDPGRVARQEVVESGHQVRVGTRAQFHHDHSGGGVGHEDDQQAVPFPGDELPASRRQVVEAPVTPGLDGDFGSLHYESGPSTLVTAFGARRAAYARRM